MTAAVLEDVETAPIDEKLRAVLRFLRKVTLEPAAVGPDDVRPLKNLGVARQAVEDALSVAFHFNLIARLADAFGWALETQAGFDASAKVLLGRGYQLPMRGKRQAEIDARAAREDATATG